MYVIILYFNKIIIPILFNDFQNTLYSNEHYLSEFKHLINDQYIYNFD